MDLKQKVGKNALAVSYLLTQVFCPKDWIEKMVVTTEFQVKAE